MKLAYLGCVAAVLTASLPAWSTGQAQPDTEPIKAKLAALTDALDKLRAAKVDDDLLVDAEVAKHAVELALRFPEEFIDQGKIRTALSALDHGLQRAGQLKEGRPQWPHLTGRVSRAYRSRVDGTAQPYRVMIPASYDKAKPTPLYVYLHGRGDTDFETNWVGGPDKAGGAGAAGGKGGSGYIQLQAFGRFNCSFRWPGETDVLEAIESVKKRYNIDADRIVLAGFSMGGAGAWQLGLHRPDLFAAIEVDAGVLGTRRGTAGLSPAQRSSAAISGLMIDHALNVFNLPTVAYAGEKDAQLASSTSIREQLAHEGFAIEHPGQFEWKAKDLTAQFLVIPKVGHAHASGDTARQVNAFVAEAMKRGRVTPDHLRFVTYTTRYNRHYWVSVDGLQRHFEHAEVDAVRDADKADFVIKTKNISRLLVSDTAKAKKITIDGDELAVQPAATILLVRDAGHWRIGDAAAETGLRKMHGLQGPIDDAFMDSFLCVSPSGQAWNAVAESYAKQEEARFRKLFGKTYRGDARAKSDTALTPADIADNHLILFGDPGSNKVLTQILDRLPLKWSQQTIALGGKNFAAANHVPVLIYPNPLNPKRYIVLNAGLTGQGPGGAGTSFGDYSILRIAAADGGAGGAATVHIAESGLFDEGWKLPVGK